MEKKEYIENRINTKIREYDGLSKKYHRAHVGAYDGKMVRV